MKCATAEISLLNPNSSPARNLDCLDQPDFGSYCQTLTRSCFLWRGGVLSSGALLTSSSAVPTSTSSGAALRKRKSVQYYELQQVVES